MSYMKTQYFKQQHEGQIRMVLFEDHNKNGMMEGYTDNYIRIATPYQAHWANQLIEWQL